MTLVRPRSALAARRPRPRTSPDEAQLRDRLWQWCVSACLVVLAFVQSPGLVSADTKLDLLTDPVGFLGRALSLWDPVAAAGQLQNQAYGYLFPMGPFFAAGLGVGLPPWAVQRLWWAAILLLAYHGARRLCAVWRVGTPVTRTVAGLAFALAPRLLGTLGAISSEVWPMALAPWVLLPLLRVHPGEERRAAARSGAAALLLGGVNAVASGAALILPALWLLTRRQSGQVRRLQAWWVLATTAACLWWAVPLLLLGRYSPPFLDWIESSAVTTASGSLTEALRGTTQWIPGLVTTQGPRWPAAHAVLVQRPAVALGLALALLGLAGIAHRRMPHRRFLLLGVLTGLVLVTAGHVGTAASPVGGQVQALLDGVLSPLRNVHKFEPVVRIPLVLGLAHVLSMRLPLRAAAAPWLRLLPAVVAGAALFALAAPAALVGVSQFGAYREVPGYWRDAAHWLTQQDDGARTLVLPGSSFAGSVWGDPRDEPLQPFAQAPWLVRDGVPLGSGGLTRVLTAIEDRVATGQGGPDLAHALESLGVRRVLLRNDLDWRGSGAPSPLVVRQAVLSIPGARQVARFGPPVGGSPWLEVVRDDGVDQPLPAIEVVELPTSPTSLVRTVAASDVRVVSGGPEAVLTAGEATGQAFVLAGDATSRRALGLSDATVVTDTLQRRESTFAAVRNVRGPVLGAEEPFRAPRSLHDWLPSGVAEDDVGQFTVLAHPAGRATASSTSARPWAFAPRILSGTPASAFDGSGDSAWRSSSPSPVGQWVQAAYPSDVEVPAVLHVVLDVHEGADVSALTVTTARGLVRSPVPSPAFQAGIDESRYAFDVTAPPGPSTFVRVTVSGSRSGSGRSVVVRDVGAGQLPHVATTLVTPGVASAAGSSGVLAALATTDDSRPACVTGPDGITRCEPSAARPGEQDVALDRVVTTADLGSVRLSGSAVAAGSTSVDDLLRVPGGTTASASSRWVADARLRPDAAVDGDPSTYWAPSPDDTAPRLTVDWGVERTVSRLWFRTADAISGARPLRVRVTVGRQTVDREVGRDGSVTFPSTTASRLSVTFVQSTQVQSVRGGTTADMPVVVGELVVAGAEDRVRALPPTQVTGMPCGFGPRVTVDGRSVATEVTGTIGDLLAGRALSWRSCEPVDIRAGAHRLRAESTVQLVVRTLRLDDGRTSQPTGSGSDPQVQSWGRTSRQVLLDGGGPRLLTVAENANAGWTATLDGRQLQAVTVDGWAQGWAVPAGAGGVVRLEFGPQRLFVGGLALGAVSALLLLALAVVRPRRRGSTSASGATDAGPQLPTAVLVVGGAAAVVGLCGPWGLLVLPLAVAVRRAWGRTLTLMLAGAASVAAVVVSAWSPWPAEAATNRQGAAEVLAACVVAAATAWALASRSSSRRRLGR